MENNKNAKSARRILSSLITRLYSVIRHCLIILFEQQGFEEIFDATSDIAEDGILPMEVASSNMRSNSEIMDCTPSLFAAVRLYQASIVNIRCATIGCYMPIVEIVLFEPL